MEKVIRWRLLRENRQVLVEKIGSQEIRKVLVKADVSFIENQSLEVILEKLEDAYERLLPTIRRLEDSK